ncbi:protein-disulfide reductase DsbD [Campylobacter corcagiensis]|uniref:Protein-disulfide reductase DsbD n=1 Tax=Campylobacter corcagiensis TaxID=1448857 RepID=A0A7M1LEH1_9BACT|nr:protein-disulfide reductase DsbD [Campylobacter corcagiensis]QKF64871.1 thiol:disulfide interchange protein DsbD [Campylobacter corcagiensis]QOQ86969.1 protein-disulfide reductase DsbD [Campylobacter corcagiensis]
MRFLTLFLLIFSFLFAEPLKVEDAFKVKVTADKIGTNFNFDIDKSVYIYADKLKFSVANKDITEFLTLPEAKKHNTSTVFDGKFDIFIPSGIVLSSGEDIKSYSVVVKFIGCALDGFCYNPQIYKYSVNALDGSYDVEFLDISKVDSTSSKTEQTAQISDQENISKNMSSKNFFITLLTFFGYGLLLALTPCVFPMIPILSSILVSKSSKSVKSSFIISLVYVLAMALAYAIIGIFASILGASLASLLQIPWIILLFSFVFVALAFSMFGFYQLQLPASLQSKISEKSKNKSGLIGVFIMGFLSALIVGPCVAAPLAGALLFIADTGNILLGGLSLFLMGFAMGVPLLLIGLGFGKFMPKPGFWMDEISKFFGFVMLFMAVWMLSRLISGNLTLLLYAIVGIFYASFMLPDESQKGGIRQFKFAISALFFIYSTILIVGFASGSNSVFKPLENFKNQTPMSSLNTPLKWEMVSNLSELKSVVKNSKKPVMIDFWANWCVICKELDKTLELPSVQKELENFTLVKVDVTKNSSDDKEMMSEFGIYGPPALVFFKDLVELKNEQSVGFLDETKILEKLRRI